MNWYKATDSTGTEVSFAIQGSRALVHTPLAILSVPLKTFWDTHTPLRVGSAYVPAPDPTMPLPAPPSAVLAPGTYKLQDVTLVVAPDTDSSGTLVGYVKPNHTIVPFARIVMGHCELLPRFKQMDGSCHPQVRRYAIALALVAADSTVAEKALCKR